MVYDLSGSAQEKKERSTAAGKLIGIQSDSSKCKTYDPEKGRFTWVRLSLVVGYDKEEEKDEYLNVVAYDIDLSEMPELKKADELLKAGKKPFVELQYYTTVKDAVDAGGNQVMEEFEEERAGKNVVVQRPKQYHNHRMSADDIKKAFKVVEEEAKDDFFSAVQEEKVQ